MPSEMDELHVLRRRADDDHRQLLRDQQAAIASLDQRQIKLETALTDLADSVKNSQATQLAMQQQMITLIEAQTRTSQQVVSHMQAEEHVWELIQNTAEKLVSIETAVSHVSGSSLSQIDNLKLFVGGAVMAALMFAGYVMTRIHP